MTSAGGSFGGAAKSEAARLDHPGSNGRCCGPASNTTKWRAHRRCGKKNTRTVSAGTTVRTRRRPQ
eukprot:8623243-Alexandrium_andersonii.AAC.1